VNKDKQLILRNVDCDLKVLSVSHMHHRRTTENKQN